MTWELTRAPLHLGYLGLAQGAPLVCFQLLAGVLADRTSRRRLLLVTTSLTSATLILAFLLIVLGLARVPHLLVLAALSSTFRAFDEPSRMSLVPQLIDRERLPNAIALGSIPWQAGRMIGPSVTGILIAAFGGTVGFGLAAIALGGLIGAFNGFFIAVLRLQSIVVTLSTMFIVQGITLLIMDKPGGQIPQGFIGFLNGTAIPNLLPAPIVVLVIIALIWFPLRRSRLGLSLYAIGSDRDAAVIQEVIELHRNATTVCLVQSETD